MEQSKQVLVDIFGGEINFLRGFTEEQDAEFSKRIKKAEGAWSFNKFKIKEEVFYYVGVLDYSIVKSLINEALITSQSCSLEGLKIHLSEGLPAFKNYWSVIIDFVQETGLKLE